MHNVNTVPVFLQTIIPSLYQFRFNGAAENIFYMNKYTDKDSLKAAILNVAYIEGDTNIAAGIRAMSDQQFTIASGDRSNNTGTLLYTSYGYYNYDCLSQ